MIAVLNRNIIFFAAILLFIATAGYAYCQEIYFFLIPLFLIAGILCIQHPQYLFYFLMLSIPWSVEFNFNSGLGTNLPDEPFMLMGAFAVIFYLIYQRKVIQFNKLHPLVAILALQFLWTIVTVSTSTDFVLSTKYLLAKNWYLLAFIALPFFLFQDEKIFKRSVLLLLVSMMAVTIVLFLRHGMNGWTFEKVNDSVRPFFRNHVNYSSLLVFMAPLQIAIIRLSTSKTWRRLLYCVLFFTVVAVYFSYARGAWLALAAGLISYWLLRKRLLVLSLLFSLSIVIAFVFWIQSNDRLEKLSNDYKSTIYHSDFREHLIATYQLKDLSNAERIYRWIAGVRMVKDHWKTGSGPSTFYYQYKSYTLPAFKTYVSNNPEHSTVHNYFLLMLIEQGVIGCLLFIALVIALFWYAQRIYCRTSQKFWKVVIAATASVLTMQCVINFLSDMIETDKVGSVFYLCIATIIVADIKTRKERSNPSANIQSIS